MYFETEAADNFLCSDDPRWESHPDAIPAEDQCNHDILRWEEYRNERPAREHTNYDLSRWELYPDVDLDEDTPPENQSNPDFSRWEQYPDVDRDGVLTESAQTAKERVATNPITEPLCEPTWTGREMSSPVSPMDCGRERPRIFFFLGFTARPASRSRGLWFHLSFLFLSSSSSSSSADP